MGKFYSFFNRFLITCLLTVLVLIFCKRDYKFKKSFSDFVMGVNFNFSYINNLYSKYIGNSIFFSDFFDDKTSPVFNEELSYNSFEPYMDGVRVFVTGSYSVPSFNDGIVVFVGKKDGYGDVVIVNQSDGVDVWYGNLSSINVNLYDFVSKGSLLGSCSDSLFLVFKKDGNVLNYEDFI